MSIQRPSSVVITGSNFGKYIHKSHMINRPIKVISWHMKCVTHTPPIRTKTGCDLHLATSAESKTTFLEAREQENNHIKQALKKCGYPNWTFIKTHTKLKRGMNNGNIISKKRKKERKKTCCYHLCGWSIWEYQKVFSKHKISVYFKPMTTLRQYLFHPKDRIPKNQSKIV